SGKDWLKIETLVRNTIREEGSKKVQKLKRSLYHISIQNNILHAKKKQQKKSKPLDLQQRREYHGGVVFWSPRKLREARVRESVVDKEKEKVELKKARKKVEITLAKLRNLQEKKERERLRVKKREEKERVAAEKQAKQQQRIQEKENSEK
ncbi:hypothetical protein BU23DRAFT_392066, partial [Bimuria novae-zelandiae CBS 107.79]